MAGGGAYSSYHRTKAGFTLDHLSERIFKLKETKQLSSPACLETATGMLTVTDQTLGFACDANVRPRPEVSSSWSVPESVLFLSRVTALAGTGRERLLRFHLIGCERHLHRSSGVLSSY